MVPRFAKPGRSFKAIALYLTHDAEHATSQDRVAWTHTLNLAHDDIASAVDEMLWTYRDADLLKSEAGGKATPGTTKPVKHVSLNWHPSEDPDRDTMIAAAQSFLAHMGWEEHQVVIVAHNDKPHRHIHLVINATHPETGMKLDDGFEHRRAQAWAHVYEKQHGQILCAERGKPAEARDPGLPRPAWQDMKDKLDRAAAAEQARAPYDPSYLAKSDQTKIIVGNEWEMLKEQQKEDRLAFMAEGKGVYRDLHRGIYREVREEVRGDWAAYFAAKRDGLDFALIAEIRQGLIDRQKAMIDERFAQASAPVRAERDALYRAMLDNQKVERAELRTRQARGQRSPDLFDRLYGPADRTDRGRAGPTQAPGAKDNAMSRGNNAKGRDARNPSADAALDRFGIRRGRAKSERPAFRGRVMAKAGPRPSRDLASGLVSGLLSLFGSIGDGLIGGSNPRQERQEPEITPFDRFAIKRGRPPPDAGEDKARRDKREREEWQAWKDKRDRLMDR